MAWNGIVSSWQRDNDYKHLNDDDDLYTTITLHGGIKFFIMVGEGVDGLLCIKVTNDDDGATPCIHQA